MSGPCRSVERYKKLDKIEEGTYGVVFKAQDKESGEIVALKRIKTEHESEGFPLTSLREVRVMMHHPHPNIVNVREVVVGTSGATYVVMEYLDHDLKGLLEQGQFLLSEVKCLLQQLLRAVAHLHSHWIVHRDLKTSNLLYNNRGFLKVADFGLAREFTDPPKDLTQTVVTLWYRAPELLLGERKYGPAIDVWSVGCIFAEFLLRETLFPGRSEPEQLRLIFGALGTPSEQVWPGVSKLPLVHKLVPSKGTPFVSSKLLDRFHGKLTRQGLDLLMRMLAYDPSRRITAEEALEHEYFREDPIPRDISVMPTWPSSHASERAKRSRSPTENPLALLAGDEPPKSPGSGSEEDSPEIEAPPSAKVKK